MGNEKVKYAVYINKRKIKKKGIKNVFFQTELNLLLDKLINSNLAKVARETGITTRTLRHIINGDNESIRLKTFSTLLKYFELFIHRPGNETK